MAAHTAGAGAPRKPQVVVTGATGLLGRQVMKELPAERWEVMGLGFTRRLQCKRYEQCDLTNTEQTKTFLEKFKPDVVIHCAAERRPDVVQKQPEFAKQLNVDATGFLAKFCHESKAWMLFLSTDYVFDGKNPPYQTDAKPNPLNLYGKHKHDAEGLVLAFETHAVLRVPLIYGPVEFLEESSVMELYAKLLAKKLPKADNLQKRYPTASGDIAKVIRLMIEKKTSGVEMGGIFHWQSEECLTKYDMVKEIAAISKLDATSVAPDTVVPAAPRPEDSRLDCSKLERLLGDKCPKRTSFHDAMTEALTPIFVSSTFEHALGTDSHGNKKITKADLVRVLKAVTPHLSDESIDTVLKEANMANLDEILYEDFVKFIFQ